MRRLTLVVLLTALSTALSTSAVLAAPPGTTTEMYVLHEQTDFYSGSCSGELVHFTGQYNAVIRVTSTPDNVVSFTINDNWTSDGPGTGLESGDPYIWVYRSSSYANYAGQDGVGPVVIHTTYLTKIIHLGPDGRTDDYLVSAVFHYTLTPSGVEVTSEHHNDGCVGPS
jgi:hypothetical protein